MEDPERWGMSHYPVSGTLRLEPEDGGSFPLNVDGSTLDCRGGAIISRADSISLIARLPSD